jgi:hypothetical protein
MEYHCRRDSIRVGDESRDMDAEIMLRVRIGSDTHGSENIFDMGIPEEGILGLRCIPVDAQWFQGMYLEEVRAMNNAYCRCDRIQDGIERYGILSNREVFGTFVVAETDVDGTNGAPVVLPIYSRLRDVTSARIKELKVITGEGQWLASPNAGFSIDWDGLKPLVFAETGLGVFTETRASEYAQSQPIPDSIVTPYKAQIRVYSGCCEEC